MIYYALCDLTLAWFFHLMSYCPLPPCNNLSTLALLNLIMIYPLNFLFFEHGATMCSHTGCVWHNSRRGAQQAAGWTLLLETCSMAAPFTHTELLPTARPCCLLSLLPGTCTCRFFAWLLLVMHLTGISQSISLHQAELATELSGPSAKWKLGPLIQKLLR